MGQEYSATVQFVFDRARKSVRWNETLEKWTKIARGQEDPQPVPQILNGMMTPEGLYRFGSHGSPGNPAKRPLVLTIASLEDRHEGRMQPHLFDFNPLYYYHRNSPHADLVGDLSQLIGRADDPRIAFIKVIREADQVTIDTGSGKAKSYYTISLSQGCNPIIHETTRPEITQEYRWTYELRDGIWLPKTWSETAHEKDRRDVKREVTFVENLVNQPIESAAFSLPRLGLQRGDKVQDRRTQPMNQYQYEGE